MPDINVPDNWIITELLSLIPPRGIISDGDWIETKDQDTNGNIRLIQLADIGDGYFKDKSERFINEETFSRLSCTELIEGDLLIARLPDPLGRTCIFPKISMRAITVVDICIIRSGGVVNPSWLMYWINSPEFRRNISLNASGTTRKRIARKKLEGFELPLPPLAEQKQIAARLDALLAQVDTLKTRLDAIPTILKRFRQSVLAAAVSGKLTERWRAKNPEKTTLKMMDGYKPLLKPARYKSRSTSLILGVYATAVGKPTQKINEFWEWVPIVDIAKMESGHTPSRSKSEYWDGDIPWIGIKDARENHAATIKETIQHTNELGLANSASRLLPENTVCISRTASVGYVVKMGVPMATSQDFVNWVPTELINPDWLKWLFVAEKESLFRYGKGTTHTTVYFPEWLSMHVALPHIEEQTEIVRRVDQLFFFADQIEQRVAEAKKRVDYLTQSILSKAFRGDLTAEWRAQNPDLISGENSAQALLERIKAERSSQKTKKISEANVKKTGAIK